MSTPADELRAAAFQLRNPFHSPGLRIGIDPDLAQPLADWLDDTARGYDATIYAAARVFHDDPDGRDTFIRDQTPTHALTIARAINQEQQ